MLSRDESKSLCFYISGQLNNFFPDDNKISPGFLESCLPQVLKRVEFCFSHISDRYFFDGKRVLFSHLQITYNIFRTIRIKGKQQSPKGCKVLSATTKPTPETEAAAYERYHRKYEQVTGSSKNNQH